MPIVNLRKRVTDNYDVYSQASKSSDSLIYIEGKYDTDKNSPDCLALTVGDSWFDKDKYLLIDEKRGLKIKSHTGVVIKTQEKIVLPYNVYGIIFGAGRNIYQGAFVSNGKIDPGYHGNLRIGYHNASDHAIILRPGDKIGYVLFLDSECEVPSSLQKAVMNEAKAYRELNKRERFKRWISSNSSFVISLFSLLVAIASFVKSFFKM